MLAALYARYSSDNQRAESITAQFRYGREYCQRNGLTIVKEYKDEAFTGTSANRPGYQQMLADAKRHVIDVLIVHKPDRLGRNEFDYYSCRAKLDEAGVQLVFTGQSFDMSTPEGRLMENQLVGFAAFYSRNLAKEVRKGQLENVYAGKAVSAVAFGYKIGTDRKILIDESTAPAVRYVYQAFLDGKSYSEIRAWLKEHGYKTKLGNDFTSTALHDMLVNPRYIGTAFYGRNVKRADGRRNFHRQDLPEGCVVCEHSHAAIISDEQFQQVQAAMQKRARRGGRYSAVEPYALSGLIKCGECGHSMNGHRQKGGRDGKYINRYYMCSRKSAYGRSSCPNRDLNADKIESFIIKRLKEVLRSPKFLDSIISKVQLYYMQLADSNDFEKQQLEIKQKKLRKELENFYRALGAGEFDEFDRQHLATVKEALRETEARLAEYSHVIIKPPSAARIREFVSRQFLEWTKKYRPENIRPILDNLIDKITVTIDTVTICYKFCPSWCDWCDSNARPAA